MATTNKKFELDADGKKRTMNEKNKMLEFFAPNKENHIRYIYIKIWKQKKSTRTQYIFAESASADANKMCLSSVEVSKR